MTDVRVHVTDVTALSDVVRTGRAPVRERDAGTALSARLGAVARTTAALRHLDPAAVRDAVCEAVLSLGYDGAALAVLDRAAGTVRAESARGLLAATPTGPRPLAAGVTRAVARGDAVVVADYRNHPDAVPTLRAAGVRTLAALPVVHERAVIGVLHAACADLTGVGPVDLEVLDLLAGLAATALDDAEQHQITRAEHARSRVEAAQLAAALRSRAVIDQAKGILMAVHRVDAETAFTMLRKRSQDGNVKLSVVAADFVEAHCGHPVERPWATDHAGG